MDEGLRIYVSQNITNFCRIEAGEGTSLEALDSDGAEILS